METISGTCHCGNVGFELEWPGGESIPVRACGCTFCTKHGGTYTSHPEARLQAWIEDEEQVSRYAFATGTAEFVVCSRCGAVPFVTSEISGRFYAVVNVNTFDGVDRARFETAATDFDGESTHSRLARRARTWIPVVNVRRGR